MLPPIRYLLVGCAILTVVFFLLTAPNASRYVQHMGYDASISSSSPTYSSSLLDIKRESRVNPAETITLLIVVEAQNPLKLNHNLTTLFLDPNSLTNSLKDSLEDVKTPLVLLTWSPLLDIEDVQFAMALNEKYGNIFEAIGIGKQDNLKLVKENNVLWISAVPVLNDIAAPCFVTELLEGNILMKTDAMSEHLLSSVNSNNLLEVFWKIRLAGGAALACTDPKQTQQPAHKATNSNKAKQLNQYSSVSSSFQSNHQLVDVIDERTDEFGRKHGSSSIRYCNTTRSKIWIEKHGKKEGKMKSARSALLDWRLVLDELGYPLNIFAGTLLGWYRQCDFIPYTNDIDTTLPIHMFTPKLLEVAKKHNYRMIKQFGNPDFLKDKVGGFELTFLHGTTNITLDVFFNYRDIDGKEWTSLWVGKGSQTLSRVYFHSDIIMDNTEADFQGIPIRVPKETVLPIISTYGSDWEQPVSNWQWWSSSKNQKYGPFKPWPEVNHVKLTEAIAEYRRNAIQATRTANIARGWISN